jgi:hypothetical protein
LFWGKPTKIGVSDRLDMSISRGVLAEKKRRISK